MMNKRDPKLVALLYNECINAQDLEGVINLMSVNHQFIDIKNRVENKDQMKESWKSFFEEYPDYINVFHTIISRDNFVILLGHSHSGKTQLSEALAFAGGAIPKPGKVDDGTTVSDYNEDEKERKISINSSILNQRSSLSPETMRPLWSFAKDQFPELSLSNISRSLHFPLKRLIISSRLNRKPMNLSIISSSWLCQYTFFEGTTK